MPGAGAIERKKQKKWLERKGYTDSELQEQLKTASPAFRTVLEMQLRRGKAMGSADYAEYLQSVYKFKKVDKYLQVFTYSYWHDIELRDEHCMLQALKWKYKNVDDIKPVLEYIFQNLK